MLAERTALVHDAALRRLQTRSWSGSPELGSWTHDELAEVVEDAWLAGRRSGSAKEWQAQG